MKQPYIFTKSFTRTNLSYSVMQEDEKQAKLTHILQRVSGSAIVYCRSRKRCREIADQLEIQGVPASYYHAGLTGDDRSARQELWLKGQIRVMVCTNAFGMGIDKPDVRVVVHYDAPDSLEAYYQEAGRAGRDEEKAYAVLLYNTEELDHMEENIVLQFPELPKIKEVFQCLVNYLQVPVGSAEGVYYDFDVNDFVRRFELNITMTYSALRILEQEGVLQLSESVFLPSMVEFITNKETLYAFEDAQPALEPLIKRLLRTYEGIFDNPVPVYEKQLARLLRLTEEQVAKGLIQLHQRGIIHYRQHKNEPQLCFLQDRVSADRLYVDMVRVKQRMLTYKERLNALLHYINNKETCRTQIIAAYFGEKDATPCGVCDICISKRVRPALDFKKISAELLSQLQPQPEEWNLLYKRLSHIKEDAVLEVIQFLITEGKVARDEDGRIYLR
jgi:ATP-dependent DNA helicase RecQ